MIDSACRRFSFNCSRINCKFWENMLCAACTVALNPDRMLNDSCFAPVARHLSSLARIPPRAAAYSWKYEAPYRDSPREFRWTVL